jgi:hypothetical protein
MTKFEYLLRQADELLEAAEIQRNRGNNNAAEIASRMADQRLSDYNRLTNIHNGETK